MVLPLPSVLMTPPPPLALDESDFDELELQPLIATVTDAATTAARTSVRFKARLQLTWLRTAGGIGLGKYWARPIPVSMDRGASVRSVRKVGQRGAKARGRG